MTEPLRRIHILDNLTANRIAAGEVAERPSAVVKELAENALDAGARRIEIRVFDQSAEKMQVSDDGCGMSPEDMRLAVLPHATSKLRHIDDLDHISTLGFRGEALPSVAAVSRLTLTSRPADSDVAYTMSVVEGKAGVPEETVARPGTTVLVDRLFHNTPARKKFLKAPRTELNHISDVVGRLAMSRPDVAFSLRLGNHRAVVTNGNGELRQAVAAVLGQDVAGHMTEVSGDGPVSGFVTLPDYTRSTRNYYFFINGRSVSSRELSAAVDEAYFTLIPAGRYPLAVLDVRLDPAQVDVNVHPGKLEVKLHQELAVREQLVAALRDALSRSGRMAPRLLKTPQPGEVVRDLTPPPQQMSFTLRSAEAQPRSSAELRDALLRGLPRSASRLGRSADLPLPDEAELERLAAAHTHDAADAPAAPPTALMSYAALHIIGQYHNAYILAAGADGLYIIDQHAAAERILYEQVREQAASGAVDSAQLAVPLNMNLGRQEQRFITDHIIDLRDLGFIVEYFGETSFVLRGVPLWYEGSRPDELLLDVLDALREPGTDSAALRREELFKLACRRAVKAGHYLAPPDMSRLLEQLDQCDSPFTCPHGRPIAILISEADIRKRFLRSGI